MQALAEAFDRSRSQQPRGKLGKMARKEAKLGYLFIAPWIIGFLLFTLLPIISSFYYSFTRYSVLREPVWIGLENYIDLFTDDRLFPVILINTLIFVAFSVPLRLVVAFLLAVLLNTKIRGTTIFRTIYYIPTVVPLVASAILWLWIFNPRVGLANAFLDTIGLGPVPWLTDTAWSKPTVILVSAWTVGQAMVIMLAGLQDVPVDLHEAAMIDGAGVWSRFWAVTVPIMTPVIFFNLVMGLISGFQVFALPFILTQGGPLNSTLFYNLYVYDNAFKFLKMGYASALVWILFILVVGFTYVLFGTSRRWVHYTGG
jgi:multiple sugar transport system permease protein